MDSQLLIAVVERFERRFKNNDDRTRWAAGEAEAVIQTEVAPDT